MESETSAGDSSSLPLVLPLDASLDPATCLRRLADRPHCLFLDSALRHPELGRYSFITADPFEFLTEPVGAATPFASLQQRLDQSATTTRADLPPFQGGAAGLLSYDLNRSFESIPAASVDEFQLPGLGIGLYDVVIAFDHAHQQAWLISQGFPESDPIARRERAESRLKQFLGWLDRDEHSVVPRQSSAPPLSSQDVSEQHPLALHNDLTSSFSRTGYLDAVQAAIDYIYAGDVFQVNLAQRLLHPANASSLELYFRLRERNAATFAGYFDLGDAQIVSASPERLVSVRGRHVEARPIKGTRPRSQFAEATLFAGDDLRGSEKDRAENVMITDLLRNDLSRVCTDDSVHVSQLCQLESYEYVQHLVSVVRGELQPNQTPLDLLRSAFPGGSITGAPKVRAMEIIAELERPARGPYCGSLGYIGFDGTADFSILIRTITASRGWWQFPVGGGIVAQSSPLQEYEETWHKAKGLLRALD